jgi:hypothetical protein
MVSKICLKAGSGERHIVRYVSAKGSQYPIHSFFVSAVTAGASAGRGYPDRRAGVWTPSP